MIDSMEANANPGWRKTGLGLYATTPKLHVLEFNLVRTSPSVQAQALAIGWTDLVDALFDRHVSKLNQKFLFLSKQGFDNVVFWERIESFANHDKC